MKRPTLTRSGFICILILLLHSQFGFGRVRRFSDSPTARFQNDVAWIPFIPEGEEFAAMIPAPPSLLVQPVGPSMLIQLDNSLPEEGGELLRAHRTYGGYSSGFIFIIDSYKANRPDRLLNRLLESEGIKALPERKIVIDATRAREYRKIPNKFYSRIVCLTTKEHVYVLTFATREQDHPFIDRFLSLFKLRQSRDKVNPGQFAPDTLDFKPDEVFSPKEVTDKAIIAWKTEPSYTEQARADQLRGAVILEAIFAANGYVTNIKVIKDMKDGMTERAIEYTRNIRFFPAEKDGKPVSQRMRLEYNFDLY
jgi:TonB family protein